LRLLVVTPRYFPLVGGVENHVYQVSRRLVEAGVDVTVLTTDLSGQLPREERSEGITILRVPAWPAGSDLYFAPALYGFISSGNWHLVHVQSYHTFVAPMAMLAARLARLPYVVTFHGGGHSSRARTLVRRLQRLVLRPLLAGAAKLVAVAQFEVELYGAQLHLPRSKFAVIPNGCELPGVAGDTSVPAGDPLIVSFGRLERYKGHHRLIEALPMILQQVPNARVWIAGSGPYEAELHRIATEHGVAERVAISAIPAAERERMATELSKAALVVLFSEYETQPIGVLEALHLGRSVLATDSGGLRELGEQGLIRTIPQHSTKQQVAAAVIEQLRHPFTPSGVALPTWERCATDLLTLYTSLTGDHRCASVG